MKHAGGQVMDKDRGKAMFTTVMTRETFFRTWWRASLSSTTRASAQHIEPPEQHILQRTMHRWLWGENTNHHPLTRTSFQCVCARVRAVSAMPLRRGRMPFPNMFFTFLLGISYLESFVADVYRNDFHIKLSSTIPKQT